MNPRVAVLYQANKPPIINGARKPLKPGGYADSGADIAVALQQKNQTVILPTENPKMLNDLDWVFPDNPTGIENAIERGASLFWLNSVLYNGHPIEKYFNREFKFVGQLPEAVEKFDDKLLTNEILLQHELPIPRVYKFQSESIEDIFEYPFVIKPIRGRGSEGVVVIRSFKEFQQYIKFNVTSINTIEAFYGEAFLTGRELTITIMPPGRYDIKEDLIEINECWCLPPVERINHRDGIAPYNGVVAVVENSRVISESEENSQAIQTLCRQCEKAASLVQARAPIRIDCRESDDGKFYLFDVNMKPNMTGPSRAQRHNQTSLTGLAAERIGWKYEDLLMNMLRQAWSE